MQVSPRGSDSSADSGSGQQASGAATGEASAAAGRPARGTFAIPRASPRKHSGGWMGRTAAVAGGELNTTKIAHQNIFLGESLVRFVAVLLAGTATK